jgi:hypothetical protein
VWAAKQWPEPPGNTTSIKDLLFPKMVACQIQRWGTTGLEVSSLPPCLVLIENKFYDMSNLQTKDIRKEMGEKF